MGCNCKKTSDASAKYSDDGKTPLKRLSGISLVLAFVGKLFISILAFGLIIVILPFFLLYVFFCIITGKGIRINLNKLFRINAKRK